MRPTTHCFTLLLAASPALAQTPPLQHDLRASDAATSDLFGSAVSVRGDQALVGAPGDDDLGASSGSVYLFDLSTGAQLAKLTLSGGLANDKFGDGLLLGNGEALINVPGIIADQRTVLMDLRSGAALHEFRPTPGMGGVLWFLEGASFGAALEMQGDLVVIGSPQELPGLGSPRRTGAVYLYHRTTGQALGRLIPDDPGAAIQQIFGGRWFGSAVALQGERLYVGAPRDTQTTGSVYVFDARTQQKLTRLLPPNGSAYDEFGAAVAVAGDRLLVGAPGQEYLTASSRDDGRADLFDARTHQLVATLTPQFSDLSVSGHERFGTHVALAGGKAYVSGYNYVYVFDAEDGRPLGRFQAESTPWADSLGYIEPLAADGDRLIVGMPGSDLLASDAGGARVFAPGAPLEVGTPFCLGDGSAAPCPCGNEVAAGEIEGCKNTSGRGASLRAVGDATVGADELQLLVEGLPGATGAVFFMQGMASTPRPFRDGLLCLDSIHVQIEVAGQFMGTCLSTVDVAAITGALPGDVLDYQALYRDFYGPGVSGVCGQYSGFNNFTNAVRVTWH